MKRRNLLKAVGAVGIGSLLPMGRLGAGTKSPFKHAGLNRPDCVVIPQETEGPYGLDLSGNSSMFRRDVTEGRPGTSLDLLFTLVDTNNNCRPIANARVDIWHCDKDGVYSGFQQPNINTVGQTFMRGIQMSGSDGTVRFHTVYPGWYSGRITHIHFQVFLNSVLKATSQLAFPDSLNTTVYNTPLYSTRGQNNSVANNAADQVFATPAGDLQYEVVNITANAETGGYDGILTVGVAVPVAGIVKLEPETGGQFVLRQNYPNPFRNRTSVTFSLIAPSRVELAIYDVNGRRVATLADRQFDAGEHQVEWDGTVSGARVAPGNYLFQLTTENAAGRFQQAKVMTSE